MSWHPIALADLQALLERELSKCSADQRDFFHHARVAPAKWHLSPWGDPGGGFWAVAVRGNRVLWYNDIEAGFNVSRFEMPGEIPRSEYLCNQDSLGLAIRKLQGESG